MRAAFALLVFGIYVLIGLEIWAGEHLLIIRYLHFAWLALLVASVGLMAYLTVFQFNIALWFVPAFVYIAALWWLPIAPPETRQALIGPPASPGIELLSFSINTSNQSFEAIADVIAANPAAVVCVQELRDSNRAEFLRQLETRGISYHYNFSQKSSLLLLSQKPLTPLKTMPYQKSTTSINGKDVTVWNIHSPKSMRGGNIQDRFLGFLKEDIDSDPSSFKIACGDFNATPQNTAMRRIFESLRSAPRSLQNAGIFTYPAPGSRYSSPEPFIKIDYLLFSPSFTIQSYQRLDTYAGSDHYPVKAAVILQE